MSGSKLFYTGIEESESGNQESELWITDGTDAGSRRVKDIYPGSGSSRPSHLLSVGNVVYFTATDPEHGDELWRSDGTEAGTVLVADIEPGSAGSFPRDLKVMNGKLYFHAERKTIGRELYVVDL